MNIKPCINRLRNLSALLAAAYILTAFCLPLFSPAQSAPAAEAGNEAVILDRFVVNTRKDTGYMANSTLGGTRTNTELKDLANPLDIFTQELISDLGVQDIQDLVNFAVGVEVTGAGDFNNDGQEREIWNYNYMQIRGFKVGNITRNFMALNAQFEAYNSERIEFSKGPNAILAGMGDPGGSANYSTKTPKLHKSSYSITYRTDDLGSQRVSLDANQVLIKNKLGLRLTTLWEDEDFFRTPSYERQKALHLTGQWRATRRTTVNVGYEYRDSERANPRGMFATDGVSAWINAGTNYVTGVPSNNNVIISSGTVASSSQGLVTYNADTWILDSDGKIRNVRGTARGTSTNVNGNALDTVASGYNFPTDKWIGGPNGINDSEWRIFEISVAHAFTDNFQVELAYGHSDNKVMQGNSVDRALLVDPNNFGNNTHPGELFTQSQPFRIARDFDIDHFRATAAYEIDLSKVNKWLGKHQIAVVYEHNEKYEWQYGGRLCILQLPDGTKYTTALNTRVFSLRDYLNPAAGIYAMHDYRDLYYSDGINQNGLIAKFMPRSNDSWAYYNWRVEQNTMLGVLQSRWFDDRLITTVGLRKDKVSKYVSSTLDDTRGIMMPGTAANPVTSEHPSAAPFINPPTVDNGISRNFGAVFHAAKWLSLTANYATNVAPGSESRGLDGNYLPQSSGESGDFGIRLSLLQNRLNVSLVHFRTKQVGAPIDNSTASSPIDAMQAIEDILVHNGLRPANPLIGDYTTADQNAKGEELTIIGNLTRNWTFRLTGSRLNNKITNIGPDVTSWYLTNMPYYKSLDPSLSTGGSSNLGDYIATAEGRYMLMRAKENVVSFPSSEYTVRLTSKYTFNKPSFLKGLSVGGNIRWASAPVIGYYKTTNASGATYLDTNRPVKGDDPVYMDMFIGYQRVLRRNLLLKVQININNLFDDDDPLPIYAINSVDASNFSWVPYRYRPVDGRIVSLTTSLSF